jgi:hypothetical protein
LAIAALDREATVIGIRMIGEYKTGKDLEGCGRDIIEVLYGWRY